MMLTDKDKKRGEERMSDILFKIIENGMIKKWRFALE